MYHVPCVLQQQEEVLHEWLTHAMCVCRTQSEWERLLSTEPACYSSRPSPTPTLHTQILPGPADYQREDAALREATGPAFTMKGRIEPRINDVPAPGEYEVPEAWRTGAAYTFSGRAPQSSPPDSPGPGHYHTAAGPRVGADGPAFTLKVCRVGVGLCTIQTQGSVISPEPF